ncbi:MAG: tetratricopeptide repeat protein, partial [Candidatus Goldiibacteriota bacterium]
MGLFKSDEENKKEFIAKGLEYANKNEYEKSIREFGNALKLFPRDEDALFNLAFIYSEMRQFGAAYDIFKKLININPHHIEAFNNLGLIFARQERYSDAVFVYKKGIEQNPSSAVLYNNLGNVYYDMGEFEEAVLNFKKAGGLDPVFMERLYHLGIDAYMKGAGEDVESAVSKLQENARHNINRAKSIHDIGVAYMERRMFDKAIAAFNKSILIDPNYLSAHINLGYIYQQKEDYGNAIHSFEKALTLNPKSAKIYNTIGLLYDRMEKPDIAVKMYKKALALDATYANSHYMLGQLYSNRGSVDKAVAEFTKHIRIHETGSLVDDAMRRIAELKSMTYEDVKELFSLYIDERQSGMSNPPASDSTPAEAEKPYIPAAAPAYVPPPRFQDARTDKREPEQELFKDKLDEKMGSRSPVPDRAHQEKRPGDMFSGAVPPHMINEEAVAMPLPIPDQAIEVIQDDSYGAGIIELPSRPQENSWPREAFDTSVNSSDPVAGYTQNLSGQDTAAFDSGPEIALPEEHIKRAYHQSSTEAGYIPQEPVHSTVINSVGPVSPIGPSAGAPAAPRMPVEPHNNAHK